MTNRSSRLFIMFVIFFALSVLYGNCGQGMDSVTTLRHSEQNLFCNFNAMQKVYRKSSLSDADLMIQLTPPDGDWTATGSDNLRDKQEYLDVLAVEQAHQLVYSDIHDSFEPVIVAVIDSGVDYNHPDLVNRVYRQNGQVVGIDYANNDNDPMDDNGHGTHVAGLIAAEGHNGTGIRGGAPEHVLIMPIKLMNAEGKLSFSRLGDFTRAVNYAVAHGADVINMSLGVTLIGAEKVTTGDELFADLKQALEDAVRAGVVVVIAAGNDNLQLSENIMSYPARYGSEIDGVITVGAYDATVRTISPFSNFSPVYVEVQAPGSTNSGQGLISTYPNNSYKSMPGTSMATPLVAGLVSLAKIYLKKNGIDLTPAQIEGLVKESSLQYQSLRAIAQEGRVINYRSLIERLRRIYESGIIQHPRSLKLLLGQTGRLAVQMSEFTSKLNFQWYRNGRALPEANDIELVIRNFNEDSIGSYHVVVELESGERVESLAAQVSVFTEGDCP